MGGPNFDTIELASFYMIEDIQTTRLPNGLTILTDRMPGVRSASLTFFFRTGARHEPAELNGISHFIEHAVFKGTEKRTAFEIAVEQDRLGGGFDAFTTHEETGFAIKVIDDQVAAAFDLIADMLGKPTFDERELESEQRVIIEEMKMTEDSPEDLIGDIFNESVFAGHPLGRSIVGTPQTVRSFGHDVTAEFHSRMFHASNLIVSAAGNVTHDAIVELTQDYFGHADGTASDRTELPPSIAAPIVIRRNENLEQAQIIVATPFVSGRDDRRYAADLLADVLGGGTSSRLWQKIREERGLAYSVGASTLMYRDCGLFTVFAGTSPDQVEEVVDISIQEMSRVVSDGITEDELELSKQQSRAAILLSLEDSAARAGALADAEMLHGRQIPVEEALEKLAAVTLEDVHSLAHEFFRTEAVSFAALGNLNGVVIDRDRLAISK